MKMNTPQKFVLPSPNFIKKVQEASTTRPHFLTPSGMTLHARYQPPPMYGKRGPTYPGKFLQNVHTKHKSNSSILPMPSHKTTEEMAAGIESQFCEACDMELQSVDDLRRHKAQHERCPVANCSYRGHPSVMDKHVIALHNSGLFEKFKKLSTPEEIAAWREERKRKYPTLQNTLMRQKAMEQRQKRGERIECNGSRFGKQEDRKRAHNHNTKCPQLSSDNPEQNLNLRPNNNKNNMRGKRNNNKRRRKQDNQKSEESKQNEAVEKTKTGQEENFESVEKEPKDEDEIRCCDGVYMFKGTSGIPGYRHEKSKKKKETNVLSSLLGMYGSGDESGDNTESESERQEDDEGHNLGDLTREDKIDGISECSLAENSEIEKSDAYPENKVEKEGETSLEIEHSNNTEQISLDLTSKETEHSKKSNEFPLGLPSKENTLQNVVEKPSETQTADKNDKNDQLTKQISDENPTENGRNDKSDFGDDEAPEEAPIERSSNLPPMPTKRTHNSEDTDSACNATKRSRTDQLNRLKRQKSGLDYRKARLRKQNTLLEKLLEPDIRHERNVLLQCVRYVCENKFFGIGADEKKNQ